MREIKFRAWDRQNNVMCDVELLGESVLKIKGGEWENREDFIVMQYTGIKDKHGDEIYHGYILRFYTGTLGVIVYQGQGYIWQGIPQDPHNPAGVFAGLWQDGFEVIGNIYENPELLEGRDDK